MQHQSFVMRKALLGINDGNVFRLCVCVSWGKGKKGDFVDYYCTNVFQRLDFESFENVLFIY